MCHSVFGSCFFSLIQLHLCMHMGVLCVGVYECAHVFSCVPIYVPICAHVCGSQNSILGLFQSFSTLYFET